MQGYFTSAGNEIQVTSLNYVGFLTTNKPCFTSQSRGKPTTGGNVSNTFI